MGATGQNFLNAVLHRLTVLRSIKLSTQLYPKTSQYPSIKPASLLLSGLIMLEDTHAYYSVNEPASAYC